VELPPWLAVMVVFPTPTIVTVLPETVATLELELVYETVRPEVAVAPRANGAVPYVTAEIAGKVIVCETPVSGVTVKDWETEAAAR
jgi:hypothetical protein